MAIESVRTWLEANGFERFADVFEANEIDVNALPEITEEHLKELGVPLGPRVKLLKAIAALPKPPSEAAAPAPARAEAERRQLTVMFVDLVGSTELSRRLDPEDMGGVIRAYQEACAEVIGRWGGHVAKYMGDGVLAYFGWPQAHEDEAERALRAGLELAEAVDRQTADGTQLAVRVGIATGPVVVGDLIGEGPAQEQAVVGETPNLAARLQALTAPGSVVISQATRRLVGGLFELADLGPQPLKGFAEPIRAWRVVRTSAAENRFEAMHTAELTPLVGREHELGILLERWAWAKDGDGQVVMIAGEPGIGKSRLVRALRERLGDEPYTPLSCYCSPYHTNSALYPVIGLLERAARLDRDDPPEAQLARLEAVLARSDDRLDEALPLLAALLGLPTGERYPELTLTPEVQKRRTLQALVDQLAGLAAQQPVLALYEDAHWVDPSTLELLGVVIERIRQLPVLVLITHRPEFQPPWTGQAHATTLSMARLGRRQGADLVARVTGEKPLPAAIVEQIVARTDGVPLFVEELTKTVLESGLLADAGDRWELSGPLPPLAVPTTLHDSLLARLDRLGPVKEVAQTAAVIGREFPYDLLSAISQLDRPALDDALSDLLAAELLFRRTMPSVVYAFKHALVRDTAYASLLRGKRRRIHGRIAAALFELRPDCPPELMAHHLAEAGQGDAAVEFWAEAGRQAVFRAASKEAVAYFRRALAQLSSLPDTAERKGREAVLQSALGGALVNVTGPGSQALEQAYARTRDLCQQTGDTKAQFIAEWNLWHVHTARAAYRQAQALAKRLIGVAEQKNDPDLLLQAFHLEWSALSHLGEHKATQACCERGWALYDPERHGTHHLIYGAHDPGVCSRIQGAFATWLLGQPDQARAWYEQGLALARQLNHPQVVVHALVRGLPLLELCRDQERLAAQAETAFALAAGQGFADYSVEAQIHRALALGSGGEPEPALRVLQRALRERQSVGSMWNNPYYLLLLARAQARVGAQDDALATLNGALEHARSTGEAWIEPELLRTHGEFLLEKGNAVEAAEQLFGAALAQARATSARAWELRAATSLARLWRDQGKRAQARDLLAPVYDWFTEGFDTADLQDAKALLDELR